jgi:hypothetical protein
MTPSGIEPATFRLVPQRLNQLRYQQRAALHIQNTIKIPTKLVHFDLLILIVCNVQCTYNLIIFRGLGSVDGIATG